MPGKQLRSRDDFICDDRRELGRLTLEERCESIEVGECIGRPIEVDYGSGHGRNRAVPHVRSQRTTRSCGTGA